MLWKADIFFLQSFRYRTLPREELWEKAVAGNSDLLPSLAPDAAEPKVGQTTALQRREKRLGRHLALSITGITCERM